MIIPIIIIGNIIGDKNKAIITNNIIIPNINTAIPVNNNAILNKLFRKVVSSIQYILEGLNIHKKNEDVVPNEHNK